MATILVVEDERDLNALVRQHLADEGHRVIQAFDGPSALRLAQQEQPELVVLDWMLPQLDGLEVCRRLRRLSIVPILNLDSDTRRAYLEIVQRETAQLSRLIDDLFELSTAESGGLALALQPVHVGQIVEEVASSIRSVAQSERQVTVVTQVEPDLPQVVADRQRVTQVVANLVRNAVRHTPEGGLAIVRELVEAMGGEVSAESIVGRGSRFAFALPIAGAAARSAAGLS